MLFFIFMEIILIWGGVEGGGCRCSHWSMCVTVSLLNAGTLNAILKQKGQTASEGLVWSLSGNQGDRWKQAKVSIHPTSSFQVRLENFTQYAAVFPSVPSIFLFVCVCVVLASLGAKHWCSTSEAARSGWHPYEMFGMTRFSIRKPKLWERWMQSCSLPSFLQL